MANQNGQGTGKHGHKDTQEPYPHHEARGGSEKASAAKTGSEQGRSGQGAGGSRASAGDKGGSDDLKSREYKDAQGNVHHHTKTYEQQHGSGSKSR